MRASRVSGAVDATDGVVMVAMDVVPVRDVAVAKDAVRREVTAKELNVVSVANALTAMNSVVPQHRWQRVRQQLYPQAVLSVASVRVAVAAAVARVRMSAMLLAQQSRQLAL